MTLDEYLKKLKQLKRLPDGCIETLERQLKDPFLDEYIEKLKRVKNLEQYEFEGSYLFLGKENYFFGKLWIDEYKNLIGEDLDVDWTCVRRVIEGKISIEGDLIKMKFKKLAPYFVTVYYNLNKLNDGSIAGVYEGNWIIKKFTRLKIRDPVIGKVSIIEFYPKQGNKGSLTLYKK